MSYRLPLDYQGISRNDLGGLKPTSRARCIAIGRFALILLAWGAQARAKVDYVGDETCEMCHSDIDETHIKTGHPYKIQKINGGPPYYPAGTSPGVPNPPKGMSWGDVTYVIGGYGWRARFVDKEGYILTGDQAGWGQEQPGDLPDLPREPEGPGQGQREGRVHELPHAADRQVRDGGQAPVQGRRGPRG
jgi:hypothetical protein